MAVQYTSLSGTSETTIVTSSAEATNTLTGLIITTANAAAGTLTLRDGTGGTTRGVYNYPNAAAAPTTPLVIKFPTPIQQTAVGANWTLQASANASGYNVQAFFTEA